MLFACNYHALAALAVFLTQLCLASASSTPARPLKRVAHPTTHALEILPRRPNPAHALISRDVLSAPVLRHDDALRLTLTAFGDTVHLHLHPNTHLLHPAARVAYFRPGPNGKQERYATAPLRRESVRAYWGDVVAADGSHARMRADAAGAVRQDAARGWARIVVHHQGDVAAGVAPVFEGAFAVDGVIHHVATRENYLRTRYALDPPLGAVHDLDAGLVVWRDSDAMDEHEEALARRDSELAAPQTRSCAHDHLPYNVDPSQNPILRPPPAAPAVPWYDPLGLLEATYANGSLARRDDLVMPASNMTYNFANYIGNTAGCPTTQKVIYMGVAADCTYTATYGSTGNATTQILTTWNTASALYKSTFNVSLGITELQIHDAACPAAPDPAAAWNVGCAATEAGSANTTLTLNDRLSLFSAWRGARGDDGAGLWHLMSGCPSGDEVGIAWLGTLCRQDAAPQTGGVTVSGTAVSTAGRTEWQVVAHEIGHNFGAIHDCAEGCNATTTCCPVSAGDTCDAGGQFVMNPVAQSTEKIFSPCTVGNICSLLGGIAAGASLDTTCLADPAINPEPVLALQMCGNGIVEPGEDCDPGPGLNSTCCDATTCKFAPGAVCDPAAGSACCTGMCAFAALGTVCRPATDGACDVPETCPGNAGACPVDVHKPNGLSCGGSGLACASGVCTSPTKQCQQLGTSLGLEKACSTPGDTSCSVSCQDPSNSHKCVVLQSTLVDGSPCGYGGKCSTGKCQNGPVLDIAKSWFVQNLQLSVPLAVVSVLALCLLAYGIYRAVKRYGARSALAAEPPLKSLTLGTGTGTWQTGTGEPVSIVRAGSISKSPITASAPSAFAAANVTIRDPGRAPSYRTIGMTITTPADARVSDRPRAAAPSAGAVSPYDRLTNPAGRWERFDAAAAGPGAGGGAGADAGGAAAAGNGSPAEGGLAPAPATSRWSVSTSGAASGSANQSRWSASTGTATTTTRARSRSRSRARKTKR